MAIFSSHLLDATNGSHAGNIDVIIYQLKENGDKEIFFESKSDDGGRIHKEFDLSDDDIKCEYEMICKTGDYFSEKRIVSEIIIKFKMEDQNKKYHIPDINKNNIKNFLKTNYSSTILINFF